MALSKSFVEELKSQADIVRIVSDYISLNKRGKNYVANCPFHNEKTPSFNVSQTKQIFHCFGCGVGGDVVGFIMQIEHCDYIQAVKTLAAKLGVAYVETSQDTKRNSEDREELLQINLWATEFFQQQLEDSAEGQQAIDYLEQRGIKRHIQKELKIGYAPDSWDSLSKYLQTCGATTSQIERSGLVTLKENSTGYYDRFRGRCIFPILDAQGRTVAFGGRVIGSGEPKYLNSPETVLYTKGKHLFGLYYAKEAIRKQGFAILVEGYLDFILPYQEGIQNIVASLGTALTEHQVRLLARYLDSPQIVVNFDPDKAGVAATKRSLEILLQQGYKVNVLTLPEGYDPDTFVRKQGVSAYRQLLKKSQPYIDYVLAQSMKDHDVARPAGKAAILNAVLPFLAKVPDRIERSEYADHVADKLKIEGRIIREELKRAAIGKRQQLDPSKLVVSDTILDAENRLLRLLFASPWLCQELKSAISSDLVSGLVTTSIFNSIATLIENGEELDFAKIRDQIIETESPERVKRCINLLSGSIISASDMESADNEHLRKEAENVLAALKRRKLEQQVSAVQYEINQAQKEGEMEKVTQLSLKKLDLVNQLRQHF